MNYWDYFTEPTKYTDDCYHIGSRPAPCWLIKSTDGLILIDTGLPQTVYQILLNINRLGLDFKDVKHIIHSHGHLDHIGGTRVLVELTSAKTYIGRRDFDSVTGRNQLQWANEFNRSFEEPFNPDVLIKDGDVLEIGDKKFNFLETPGHTQGTLSFFFNLIDKGETFTAGMFGGGGLNTMEKWYLDRYHLPYELRKDFIKSIDRVYDMVPDIHLGNHLDDNFHFEKLEKRVGNENPFIDRTSWKRFLNNKRQSAIELFNRDKI